MATAATFDSKVGQEEYLQILATQLRYQDPLAPLEQQEFLSQLSQFSMLSGVEQLNANFSSLLSLQQLTNGASLVGKSVQYLADGDGNTAEGTVTGVLVNEGELFLNINDKAVPLANVLQIKGTD